MSATQKSSTLVFTAFLVLCALATACIEYEGINEYSIDESYVVNGKTARAKTEGFQTYNPKQAQKNIQFEIVFPDYVPSNLEQKPLIQGTLDDREDVTGVIRNNVVFNNEGNRWKVELSYYPTDSDYLPHCAFISQYRCVKSATPPAYKVSFSANSSHETVHIRGYEIDKYESSLWSKIGPEEIAPIKSYTFSWEQDNLCIDASISGYPYNEAVKIVDSIIPK